MTDRHLAQQREHEVTLSCAGTSAVPALPVALSKSFQISHSDLGKEKLGSYFFKNPNRGVSLAFRVVDSMGH